MQPVSGIDNQSYAQVSDFYGGLCHGVMDIARGVGHVRLSTKVEAGSVYLRV